MAKLLCLMLAGFLVGCRTSSPEVRRASKSYREITLGMGRTEVYRRIGQPTSNDYSTNQCCWSVIRGSNDKVELNLAFLFDEVDSIDRKLWWAKGNDSGIQCYGTAVACHWSPRVPKP
jgi:hypothetical protein